VRKHEAELNDTVRRHEAEINDAWSQGEIVSPSLAGGAETLSSPEATAASSALRTSTVRRRNWRIRRTALPAWYKRASLTRARVQSGAARVARHRPATLKRPTRFL
jgi:sec-independent protein translocase protein TatB